MSGRSNYTAFPYGAGIKSRWPDHGPPPYYTPPEDLFSFPPPHSTEASWVAEATENFGRPATQLAKAEVNSVFCKIVGTESSSAVLEEIPGVGLLVAAVYYSAEQQQSKHGTSSADHNSTFATNVRAILALLGDGVAFCLMQLGSARKAAISKLGRQLGLLLQMAIFNYYSDAQREVPADDICATRLLVDLATVPAAALGGAAGLKSTLADPANVAIIQVLLTSPTLASHVALVSPLFSALVEHMPDDN
ncbi:hypothetical protein GOP47_0018305 [Adiantum capillus-veneris]|uniref:Uncharacterized protein n=1 Tax=Adiantum capillus-veneris TaxID=13818 RepID=A0A9D4ZBG8_ADICA|nr:hypothetical protein GOP47_0018305 [Adiantum capillus-veneris]